MLPGLEECLPVRFSAKNVGRAGMRVGNLKNAETEVLDVVGSFVLKQRSDVTISAVARR